MSWPWTLLLAWLAMSTAMAALWLVQRRTGDPAIVDVGWTFGVGLLAILFCAASRLGDPARRWLIGGLAGFWSLRLGGYLLRRVLTTPKDGRYAALQRRGLDTPLRMFRYFQSQALAGVLFATPMLLAARCKAPLGLWDALGAGIWLVAVTGESVADWQLMRFRRDRSTRGQVCQTGLWRYSRHPNYFFEWLHWWAYACFAARAPCGWLAIGAPLGMLWLFLRVTGIPPAEEQSLRSRGGAYRAYQRKTSVFFPWPPRERA